VIRRALQLTPPAPDTPVPGEPRAPSPDAAEALDTSARIREIWNERLKQGRGTPGASLGGRRVLSLESRRSPELALLVMNYGGQPFVAPAVREVALESNDHVVAFARDVIAQRFEMVVLLTGVGIRMMMKVIEPALGHDAFVQGLARTRLAARGPKPVAALRELGLTPWAVAPSPNTWRELLDTLDAHAGAVPLNGARLAVQEYGAENADLVDGLTARGAAVRTVPVYRWAMPEDIAPLRRAVWALIHGEIDIVVLTASVQLVHLLSVAKDMGLSAAVRKGLERTLVVSIGPMTSGELRRHALPVDFEPSHPKMGFLVKEVAEQCDALLRAKRCTD
jgi:uroporphyrinogen-III synthase